MEDFFNMVPSARGSHGDKCPLDDTTYEAFPVSCTPALALTAMRSLIPASSSLTAVALSPHRVPLSWSVVCRALGRSSPWQSSHARRQSTTWSRAVARDHQTSHAEAVQGWPTPCARPAHCPRFLQGETYAYH